MMLARTRHFAATLWRCSRGAIIIEFAMLLPLLALAGLGGIELANFAITSAVKAC